MEVPKRLMLVEDNNDNREVFAMILSAYGYSVTECADGSSAIQQASEQLPNVAIIDIGLPDLNGYEVAKAIRSLSGSQNAPEPLLVALTGRGGAPSVAQSKSAGFDLHFSKPAEIKKIHAEIESCLNALTARGAA